MDEQQYTSSSWVQRHQVERYECLTELARRQVFQIETKKTHELSISDQAIAVLRLLNVRTVLLLLI
jgi:hypothetical protein